MTGFPPKKQLLLLLCGFIVPTQAEETLDSLLELSLAELLQVKVQSATLTAQSQADTPAAASVFTRQEIDHLGVEYLHELLALVPGYQTSRASDFSYQYTKSARFWKSEATGPHILYLIDGRPMNGPRHGSEEGLFLMPVSQIERLEVIRGPGSALYGSNAFTGVVNIISRKKTNLVSAALGSHNMIKAELLTHKSQGSWLFDLAGYFRKAQGDSYTLPDSFSPDLVQTRDPIKQHQLRLRLIHNNTELTASYRKLNANGFINTAKISNKHNFSEQVSQFIGLKHDFNWLKQVRAKLFIDYLKVRTVNGNQNTPAGVFAHISQPSSEEPLYGYGDFIGNRFMLNWQNDWHISERASFQFGVEIRRVEQSKARAYSNFNLEDIVQGRIPIRYDALLSTDTLVSLEEKVNSAGLYGQYQHQFNDRWDFTAGARYDDYETFGSHFSPRLALIYHHTPQSHFKFLYGEAYRAPNYNETSLTNSISIKGNPNLTPEVVKTYEMIWLRQWQQAQMQWSLFDNSFVDPVLDINDQGVRTFINGDKEHSQGSELELQLQASEHWLWRFSFTHFWLRPDSAFREADTLASLQSNYHWNQWNLNLALVYNSERQMLMPEEYKLELPDESPRQIRRPIYLSHAA